MRSILYRGVWHSCRSIVGSLCLVFLFAACASGNQVAQPQQTPTTAARVDAYLIQEVKAEGFSGSVLIAKDDKLLLSKGYSMANWEQHQPNTPQTKFAIGSITKEFTAMAILILQEQGKIHVQDHICLYLSSCPQAWKRITIRELLLHISGIPRDVPQLETLSAILVRLQQESLDFAPGTRFNYSNSGYIVLGTIIEKVAGQSYEDFLQRAIFTPLKMTHTGYDYTNPNISGIATNYRAWQVLSSTTSIVHQFSAYGLYSTTEDLYNWDQALATGSPNLISRKSLDTMFTSYVLPCDPKTCSALSITGYGYGWYIGRRFNSRYIFHPGDTVGSTSYNAFYPDAKTSIIVLSNLQSSAAEIVRAALDPIVFASP